MPYVAQVLQIFVASPGDVNDERELVANVIQEWNYLNSHDRSVVLLPLRWETHAYPEIGLAPQAAINKQVVDNCDMAIGVFWTRLGTPTENAQSGTAEEIARVAEAGKPVMLYFSEAKIRPQSIDLDQFKALEGFKEALRAKALIESYNTAEEFRDKLRMHLDRSIRDIVSHESAQNDRNSVDEQNVVLGITTEDSPSDLSSITTLEIRRMICTDRDQVPDYKVGGNTIFSGSASQIGWSGSTYTIGGETENPNYYRQLVDYYCEVASRSRAWLAVANSSDQSIREIHLDVRVKANSNAISINLPSLAIPQPSSYNFQTGTFGFLSPQGGTVATTEELAIDNISSDEWRLETDIPIVQARRTVLSPGSFLVRANEGGNVTFDATTYSSDALPFSLRAELEIVVKPMQFSYRDILKRMIPGYGEGVTQLGPAESKES